MRFVDLIYALCIHSPNDLVTGKNGPSVLSQTPGSNREAGNYWAWVTVVEATAPRSARPFSNCGPHILSQFINRLTALPMKLFFPYMAQVTTVWFPSGLKVKSTVAIPSIGLFQSIR